MERHLRKKRRRLAVDGTLLQILEAGTPEQHATAITNLAGEIVEGSRDSTLN